MASLKPVYALNTSTISGCSELSPSEMIGITAKAGYDGIEPWVREIDRHVQAGGTVEGLRKQIDDAGLKVVNLIGFFEWASPDAAVRKKAMDEARRNFTQAQALGCPLVAAPPMGIHQLADLDLFFIAERYAELIDLGAEFGVVPVLEFWGMAKKLGKLGEALLVAAECGRKQACILADIFHMYKGSGRFDGLDIFNSARMAILHMNDYPASPARADITDADRVYPGDGIAPWPQIMASLARTGFAGAMSLELFNKSYWQQDALTVARTGLKKMKRVVKAAKAKHV